MSEALVAPAVERNRDPILAVLRRVLPAHGSVLEIASGTGEHTAWFAEHLPGLVFQPSDLEERQRRSIVAWAAQRSLANVQPPLALDATASQWQLPEPIARDLVAVLCINMIHISPWDATLGLFRNVGKALPAGGVLYLYGPYRRGGQHTAPSNAEFDRSLQARNPAWGVRALEDVVGAAAAEGFRLAETLEMPANNLSVVLRR